MTIRLVIVDDSPFVREVLREVLRRFDDIEIVGEAANGERAIEAAKRLKPDVMTMDLLMPFVGGLESIRQITAQQPTPIIVLADDASEHALDALEAGAIEIVPKPRSGFSADDAERLADLIRIGARTTVSGPTETRRILPTGVEDERISRARALGLVASTGGPPVIRKLLSGIPRSTKMSVFVVQHTTMGSTKALAKWLQEGTPLRVTVAEDDVPVTPGTVYVAPDDAHLAVVGRRTKLSNDAPVAAHRPSGSTLLRSLAEEYGSLLVAIVATGMGGDGADGLRTASELGAVAIVQSPSTATIDGMPRRALEAVRDALVLTPAGIATLLQKAGSR